MAMDLGNTKVMLIVAQEGFEEDELFVPEDLFSNAGAYVKIASNDTVTAHSTGSGVVEPDIAIFRIKASSLDALAIAGGRGSPRYLWGNPDLLDRVRESHAKGKIVGAISQSVMVLAQAGVLEGRRAAAPADPVLLAELKRHGGVYEDAGVAVDGNVVTARGAADAGPFAEAILGLLQAKLAAPQH